MRSILKLSVFVSLFLTVKGPGLLILYRPYEISHECAFSRHLRYDLSFGMGMSDTITLVFRTLNSADYECVVEIVSDSPGIYLIIVILYPDKLSDNCKNNPDAFAVLKKNKCFRLCDTISGRIESSNYFVTSVADRFRFRFASNSSINADMKAHMYQVTATSARLVDKKDQKCLGRNETACINNEQLYCFTSGVVCDGIKNCGVADWFDERKSEYQKAYCLWVEHLRFAPVLTVTAAMLCASFAAGHVIVRFDERKSECDLPVEHLGFAPVFAVTAAMLCAALAAGHIIMRCLPPTANSFFVFNANEDNRLCMDTVFEPPDEAACDVENVPRASLVPVSSSSSSDHEESQPSSSVTSDLEIEKKITEYQNAHKELQLHSRPVSTMRSMTTRIQDKFRAVAKRGKTKSPPGRNKFHIHDSLDV